MDESSHHSGGISLPRAATRFAYSIIAVGATVFLSSILQWDCHDYARFATIAGLAIIASQVKVTIPGFVGSLTASLVLLFVSIVQLSLGETIAIATISVLVGQFWKPKSRPTPLKIFFNLGSLGISVSASYSTYHELVARVPGIGLPAILAATAAVYFFLNTLPVAFMLAYTTRERLFSIWRRSYLWAFAFYFAGSCVAGILNWAENRFGWQLTFLVIPILYAFYRSYQTFMARLEDSRRHAEEVAALHLRSIHALALAVEAKDGTTHAHLQRVQTYALEVGRELGISGDDLKALQAASILHDVGKLAVPEYIISKPGKLTPEEFEKMKTHTVVGAEIVEGVGFPYPVAPIVRAHHEKWNGSGYPSGLKAEEIPIGARILAAVDCLDALASDRQYRRALPIERAMEIVASEAGKAFDPRVVDALQRRYIELEAMASANAAKLNQLSTHIRIQRGEAPDAGFEMSGADASSGLKTVDMRACSLRAISATRMEMRTLSEVLRGMSNSTRLEYLFLFLSARLQSLIPHDALAVFQKNGDQLLPTWVHGHDATLLADLKVPVGQGLVGWVAENHKWILNGCPSVEPGAESWRRTVLQSALAVPLVNAGTMLGVLALYSRTPDNFSCDHLRILDLISPKLVLFLRPSETERETGYEPPGRRTDDLAGLAAFLVSLDAEIGHAAEVAHSLTPIRMDLHLAETSTRAAQPGAETWTEYLKRAFGPDSLVAPFGEGEFAILLRDRSPEAVTESLQQVYGAVGAEHEIHAGIAEYPKDGASAEDLFASAERQMAVIPCRTPSITAMLAGLVEAVRPTCECGPEGSAVPPTNRVPSEMRV